MKSKTIKELENSLYTFPCIKCGYENNYNFPHYEKEKFKCKICNKPENYFKNEFNRIRINDFVSHIIIFLDVWEQEIKNPSYTTKYNFKREYIDNVTKYKQLIRTSKNLLSPIEIFISLCEGRITNYINTVIRTISKEKFIDKEFNLQR